MKSVKAGLALVRQNDAHRPFSIDPTQALYWSDDLPSEEEVMIEISDGFTLVSKSCVDVLKQFQLGRTRLIPLPLYEKGTEELLSDELWYLLELSE